MIGVHPWLTSVGVAVPLFIGFCLAKTAKVLFWIVMQLS